MASPKDAVKGPKQSEKGPKQSEKGRKQSEKGPKQSEKGPKQSEKGPKQSEKGGPAAVVEDVFRRVSGLGGYLVVAFIAPVPPSGADDEDEGSERADDIADEARDINAALLEGIERSNPLKVPSTAPEGARHVKVRPVKA